MILRADRWVDIEAGKVRSPAVVVVAGNRIAALNPNELPTGATEIDLGDVTLLPGLMDLGLNLFTGGPKGLPAPMHGFADDPMYRAYRAAVNAHTTLLAGFTTVRNLGLDVKTGGSLSDVALARAIDEGWVDGPRLVPAISPLGLEQGVARGVGELRRCVRYQIRRGAKVIHIAVSGGGTSHSAVPGARQYSDDELDAITDEAHRAGIRVVAHAVEDHAVKACILARVDCIERGSLVTDKTIQMLADCGVFLVSTTHLATAVLPKALEAGVKVASGSDAPVVPHGENAKELVALVACGMTPMQALRAATLTGAELLGAEDELGRLAPGCLADIIAVPDDPGVDIQTTQDVCFVMKDGCIYQMPTMAMTPLMAETVGVHKVSRRGLQQVIKAV